MNVLKEGELHRCRECGALWWLVETPPVGLMWTLRTPYPCGKCCDNSSDFLAKIDFVCSDYKGQLFPPPTQKEVR
jgi:hypothetical protein